jgi:WD40 repeat protein
MTLSMQVAQSSPSLVYQEWTYADLWRRQQQETPALDSIQDLLWDSDSNDPNDTLSSSLFLFGCTRQGYLCVWKVPVPNETETAGDDSPSPNAPTLPRGDQRREPVWRQKISPTGGSLHSLQWMDEPQADRLLVAGDGGIFVVNATRLRREAEAAAPSISDDDVVMLHLRTHPSATGMSTVLDCQAGNTVGTQQQHVYGAANDAFGGYQWDCSTGQVVRTMGQQGATSLAWMEEGGSRLALGGMDGVVNFWDIKAASAKVPVARLKSSWKAPVQVCRSLSNDWLVVGQGGGGGSNAIGSGRNQSNAEDGYLATWHVGMRECVAQVSTRASIQACDASPARILSGGNDGRLLVWAPYSLQQEQQVAGLSVPSIRAVASSPSAHLTAVSGVGRTVDLLNEHFLAVDQLHL